MLINELIQIFERLDRPGQVAQSVARLFENTNSEFQFQNIKGEKGETEFIKITIRGSQGKTNNGDAPTLGIIGRLGGIGARPEKIGFVSDGDGALVALTVALKLARMNTLGDKLAGDVIITTQLCTSAPTLPKEPVPFMDSPIDLDQMNALEVDPQMDAILSIDTTRGNRIINTNGFAITPTVKQTWILPIPEKILRIFEYVTGAPACVIPLTQQDVLPNIDGISKLNSIVSPALVTQAPVIGIGLTAMLPIPGCATGASNFVASESAARFALEIAKEFTAMRLSFFDQNEFALLSKTFTSPKLI